MAKVDKVKPLKFENSTDGTENDQRPTQTDPSEDHLAAKGVTFENNDDNKVFGDGGLMKFLDQDTNNASTVFSLFDLRNAVSNAFSAVGWAVTNVRDAILEAKKERKAGLVDNTAFAGNPKTYAVVFTTPHTSANYKVNITGIDARAWSYESKTVNGFTINSNANQVLTGEVTWETVLTGE